MSFRQIFERVLFCVMLLVFVSAPSAPAQQTTEPVSDAALANATVADIKGKIHVQLPGQALSAPTLGQVLPADSEINTGDGQMLLRLEDGSEVLVHPHSHLVLKQPSPSNWQRLELLFGRIRTEVQKRISGAPPFQVGTPSAVISVRGTRFYVDVDKHKNTEVDVEEGEVQLESIKGIGAPVIIPAGSSSRVGENSPPEPVQPTSKLQQKSGKSSSEKAAKASDGQGDGTGSGHAAGTGSGHGSGSSSGQGQATGHTHSTPKASGKHWIGNEE